MFPHNSRSGRQWHVLTVLGSPRKDWQREGPVHSEACPETEAWRSAALCRTLLIGPGFPMKSLAGVGVGGNDFLSAEVLVMPESVRINP